VAPVQLSVSRFALRSLLTLSLDILYIFLMADGLNEALRALNAELAAATTERDELEIQLRDKDIKIVTLRKAISHVLNLMGLSWGTDLSELGITDAIRQVTTNTFGRMTANQVRDELEKKGFKLSGYDNPMASIYKILTRLAESGELELEKEGWNTFYKRKATQRMYRLNRQKLRAQQALAPKHPTIETWMNVNQPKQEEKK